MEQNYPWAVFSYVSFCMLLISVPCLCFRVEVLLEDKQMMQNQFTHVFCEDLPKNTKVLAR